MNRTGRCTSGIRRSYALAQVRVGSTSRQPSGSWRVTPQVSQYGLCAGTCFAPGADRCGRGFEGRS
jgi:hypothetical protein